MCDALYCPVPGRLSSPHYDCTITLYVVRDTVDGGEIKFVIVKSLNNFLCDDCSRSCPPGPGTTQPPALSSEQRLESWELRVETLKQNSKQELTFSSSSTWHERRRAVIITYARRSILIQITSRYGGYGRHRTNTSLSVLLKSFQSDVSA